MSKVNDIALLISPAFRVYKISNSDPTPGHPFWIVVQNDWIVDFGGLEKIIKDYAKEETKKRLLEVNHALYEGGAAGVREKLAELLAK